jgi:hypothetical protein
MFSKLSDRLFAAVLAPKAVHGKKATQECLSSAAISMKFARDGERDQMRNDFDASVKIRSHTTIIPTGSSR